MKNVNKQVNASNNIKQVSNVAILEIYGTRLMSKLSKGLSCILGLPNGTSRYLHLRRRRLTKIGENRSPPELTILRKNVRIL